jgi:hypothetical protein
MTGDFLMPTTPTWAGYLTSVGLLLAWTRPAVPREQYLHEFRVRYEREFLGNEEAAKCAVCHVGLVKRSRNNYGQAMNKVLAGRNVKESEKIRRALAEIENQPSAVPGKTFGQLIKEGRLPGSKE